MARRKTVAPGYVVENGAAPVDENKTALDGLQESCGPYQPGMAPLVGEDSPEAGREAPRTSPEDSGAASPDNHPPGDPDAPGDVRGAHTLVVLKKGASFWFRGCVFKKDEPGAVEEKIAERLVRSGYFERG